MMNKAAAQDTTIILINTGFEEELTITWLKQLRGLGFEAKLVGLTAGLLVGIHGLTVRPDLTLAGLETCKGYRLIVLPGTTQSTRSMLADPRVHQLFAATTGAGGQVAVMGAAEEAFVQAGLLDFLADSAVKVQGEQDAIAFVDQLVHLTVP